MVGLREFRKYHRDCSFTYKLKELYWELRYACQRAWRGYDDVDVFELSSRFTERMVPVLRDFRKYNVGLFYDRELNKQLDEKETNDVIEEMLFHFSNSDESAWLESGLTPFNPDDYPKIEEIEASAREHEKLALNMFYKWFDNLWF